MKMVIYMRRGKKKIGRTKEKQIGEKVRRCGFTLRSRIKIGSIVRVEYTKLIVDERDCLELDGLILLLF